MGHRRERLDGRLAVQKATREKNSRRKAKQTIRRAQNLATKAAAKGEAK
jgi:hypothetical protein